MPAYHIPVLRMAAAGLLVLAAARRMLGRTDVNFAGTHPSAGLVCVDVFVLACEAAGIPLRAMMRRLYQRNPAAYPPDGGPPTDVNFTRRIRNVAAFLRASGLWHPAGPAAPGDLIVFTGPSGIQSHTGVVGETERGRAVTVVMATGYGGPPAAVREVDLARYLSAQSGFTVAGYGKVPPIMS